MENFQAMGGLAEKLHFEFVSMYYMLLPLFFALAIAVDWFRNPSGSADFLETLKRAVVATLLVAGFQEISEAILALSSGVADKISDLSGLDNLLKLAATKARSYPNSPISLVLGFDDLVVAILSFASYLVMYFARYIMVALYHFMWIFLSILSPLLMLFHLFRGTSQIPANLFKSLCEVASYKIVWAVLSAMLTALSVSDTYSVDGNYLTVIILNFVIALAMLATPMIVKSLVGGGLSSAAQSLGTGAAVAMVSMPSRITTLYNTGRNILGDSNSSKPRPPSLNSDFRLNINPPSPPPQPPVLFHKM